MRLATALVPWSEFFQTDAEFTCTLWLEDRQQPSLSYSVFSEQSWNIAGEGEKHFQVCCLIAGVIAILVTSWKLRLDGPVCPFRCNVSPLLHK